MLKSMVFIDYQNFSISMKKFIKSSGIDLFNINYDLLSKRLNCSISLDCQLVKTYLFAHKPCDQLLQLDYYKKHYSWLSSIGNTDYFEVIEGSQEIRQISDDIPIDINRSETYRTKEKGTDINLAVHMLSKAFQNSLDVAILVSGDTDYLPVIETLHQLGKIVVIATLPNQNIKKYAKLKDANIILNMDFLNACNPKATKSKLNAIKLNI